MPNVVFPPLPIQIDGCSGIVVKRDVLPTLVPYNFLQFFQLSVSGSGGFDFSQHSQSVDGREFKLFDRHVTRRVVYHNCRCRRCPENRRQWVRRLRSRISSRSKDSSQGETEWILERRISQDLACAQSSIISNALYHASNDSPHGLFNDTTCGRALP